MKTKNSGFAMIILLISVLIVALLSLYAINKMCFKKTSELGKENSIDYQAPNLQNAQSQVDTARQQIKDIENKQNSDLENVMNQK